MGLAQVMADGVRREVHADHEVWHPPHRLARALSTGGAAAMLDMDAVARAEAALAGLSGEFTAWMEREVAALDAARLAVRAAPRRDDLRGVLFRAAHDLRGDAATFGYPVAGEVAGGLCRLLEVPGLDLATALPLVDRHVDAVRAMVREGAEGGSARAAMTARLLADQLASLVDQVVGLAADASGPAA